MKLKEYLDSSNFNPKDYNFTENFEKGDVFYFIRIIENTCVKELVTLKARTVMEKTLIATEEKTKIAYCIGVSEVPLIFSARDKALEVYKKIHVPKKNFTISKDD